MLDDLYYMENTDGYVAPLENAYASASKTLLELLVGERDLIGHLRSVRHYFLMDQVDFQCMLHIVLHFKISYCEQKNRSKSQLFTIFYSR